MIHDGHPGLVHLEASSILGECPCSIIYFFRLIIFMQLWQWLVDTYSFG